MNNNREQKALTGAEAAAHAMRQINPDVVAAYPITPQTPIAETFAKFVADGLVDTEFIRVESEHSAMSAVVGASAVVAGATRWVGRYIGIGPRANGAHYLHHIHIAVIGTKE